MKKISWVSLILNLALPLTFGFVSWLVTRQNMNLYEVIYKPSFSPPPVVFSIVWPILFILMGISSYLIVQSDAPGRTFAQLIYLFQLVINLTWSVVFFNTRQYGLAFAVIIVLWLLILFMIVKFYKINKTAGLLQIPYLLWVTFAAVLNFAIYQLN